MIEWSEQHEQIRAMVRRFVETEIVPHLEALEHGGMAPYDLLRKMLKTFGATEMARAQFERRVARREAQLAAEAEGSPPAEAPKRPRSPEEAANQMAMRIIPIIELSRYSPGMVTALGVSVGLTPNAIMARGTVEQMRRWALPLLTMETIGAWAITEPHSGSDAFGGMKATARPSGDGYVLNGSKTFITNGPQADTIVFICKLDTADGDPAERPVVSFVLDKGMPGLTQSAPLRKMGLHASPTGELFVEDLHVGADRLLGGGEPGAGAGSGKRDAKATFTDERTAVAAMALGIVEECLKLCTEYARTRVAFGKAIGEFQLIQLKLAKMEVARVNIQNLVFRQIELAAHGQSMSLAEASACKLYCAQAAMETCLEAVQLFGGNGYMAEFRVEQLCRDAKVLQIYGGTDEIQVTHIARDLLAE